VSGARRGERGLGLAEVLVSLTILSLAAMVALFLYDAARKSFQKGENAAEQQQSVRIAFDRMASDLRLAGYNANPDGDPLREDEGLEAAYDTAVVLRADLDAEADPERTNPEVVLAGGAHAVEAVGNDEIVAYVLAKPDGSSRDTLVFDADVKDQPRDGVVETVRIPGVALVQDDPPYTLYRITLNDDVSTWGGANFFTRTPMLDNVRSLTFRYFDAAGPLSAFDLGNIADDIGGADTIAGKRARSGIRRIELDVDGLTRDPDLQWVDPNDPSPATNRFRKFHLRSDITPRNIGKMGWGLQDFGWDETPPSRPAAPTLVPGHCEGLFVTWAPNPLADGVAGYRVLWRKAGGGSKMRTVAAQSVYLEGLDTGADYFISVVAVDAAGNTSAPSEERQATTVDVNFPEPPVGIVASTDLPNRIRLTWDAVTENSSSEPSGDARTPPNATRDLKGYRLLRGLSIDFSTSSPSTVTVANESATGVGADPEWTDRTVVACRDYYYRVLSWDLCDHNDDTGAEYLGRAQAEAPPAKPAGLRAVDAGGVVRLSWDPVTVDRAGNEIFIDDYEVERCDGGGACSSLAADSASGTFDDVTPGLAPTYRVRARNACTSNNESEWSDPASPGCTFAGDLKIENPTSGWINGRTTVRVTLLGGLGAMPTATLDLVRVADGTSQSVAVPGSGSLWLYDWTPPAAGGYLLRATLTNASGCTTTAGARVFVGK